MGLFTAAVRLGFDVHVFDRRPLTDLPGPIAVAVADGALGYTRVETRDVAAVMVAADKLATRTGLVAVVPGFEYVVEICAYVAARLGLPGLELAAAHALSDKLLMKRPLAADARIAPAVVIQTSDDRMCFPADLTFPLVVKPVDGCGSLLVRRIDTLQQLREYIAGLRHAPLEDMGRLLGGKLLIEPYIDGPEFSVEGFVVDGRINVAAVTEKLLGPEPHFVETGHIIEAVPDPARCELLTRTAVRAVRALGITVGAFHLETRLTTAGPVVIEVAARLGGDLIPDLVARVHGRDLYEATILTFAGLGVPAADPRLNTVPIAAVRFFTVQREIQLADSAALASDLAKVPGCEKAEILAAADAVLRPATDFRQRFGYALVTASDRGELDSRLDELDRITNLSVCGALCES